MRKSPQILNTVPAEPGWHFVIRDGDELRLGGSVVAWCVDALLKEDETDILTRGIGAFGQEVCYGYQTPSGRVETSDGFIFDSLKDAADFERREASRLAKFRAKAAAAPAQKPAAPAA